MWKRSGKLFECMCRNLITLMALGWVWLRKQSIMNLGDSTESFRLFGSSISHSLRPRPDYRPSRIVKNVDSTGAGHNRKVCDSHEPSWYIPSGLGSGHENLRQHFVLEETCSCSDFDVNGSSPARARHKGWPKFAQLWRASLKAWAATDTALCNTGLRGGFGMERRAPSSCEWFDAPVQSNDDLRYEER